MSLQAPTVNRCFDHVYVGNLRRRPDRRSHMEARLARLGIQAEFVAAIDGRGRINRRQYAAFLRRPLCAPDAPALEKELNRKLLSSPGAWACNKTFYGIVADAKRRGMERILILEDDALFHTDFPARFAEAAAKIPPDWRVWFLGASQLDWRVPDALVFPGPEPDPDTGASFYTPVKTNGGFALALHTETFKDLLGEVSKMDCPFDSGALRTVIGRFPGRCFVSVPNLVIADVTDSDIRPGLDPREEAVNRRWNPGEYDDPPPARRMWRRVGAGPRGLSTYPTLRIDPLITSELEPLLRTRDPGVRWTFLNHIPTGRGGREILPSGSGAAPTRGERVLILTPVKNAARFLPRYFENLRSLDYPDTQLSIGFLESDSDDDTHKMLVGHRRELRRTFRRVRIIRKHFGFKPERPRWAADIQRQRRSILAESRNLLLRRALRDEDWVLWMDVDLESYPPDILRQLIAAGKDIVVPHCVFESGGRTFDLNTFQLKPESLDRDMPPHLVDGILQPPKGVGRWYLEDLRDHHLVRVDGVGGTMLLVGADLHRQGLDFPATPYKGYIETEALGIMARDRGIGCWGMPNLEIIHPAH